MLFAYSLMFSWSSGLTGTLTSNVLSTHVEDHTFLLWKLHGPGTFFSFLKTFLFVDFFSVSLNKKERDKKKNLN